MQPDQPASWADAAAEFDTAHAKLRSALADLDRRIAEAPDDFTLHRARRDMRAFIAETIATRDQLRSLARTLIHEVRP